MLDLKLVAIGITLFVYFVGTMLYKLFTPQTTPRMVDLQDNPLFPVYLDPMFICGVFYVAFLIQITLVNYQISMPYNGVLIVGAVFWSAVCHHSDIMLYASDLMNIFVPELNLIYIPTMMFHMTFSMDVSIFLKSLPQILIIGIVAELLAAVLYGTVAMLALTGTVDLINVLLLGIFSISLSPHTVIKMLKQESSRIKQMSTLLEGDTLMGYMITDIYYNVFKGIRRKVLVHWYHFAAVTIRLVIFALGVGAVGGLVGRLMIRKMYQRTVAVFLTCLAIPFLTFIVSKSYAAGAPSISMVVVGIMMGLERIYLPKEIDTLVTDFWEMLAFMLDSIACVHNVLVCMVYIMPTMTWEQYVVSLVIYLLHYVIRFVSFLMLSPVVSMLGYDMNLQNTMVCVWAGVKGPLGALCLNFYYQKDASKEHIGFFLFYIVTVYSLSVLINGTFTIKLLDVLNLTKIPFAKQTNMTTCMRLIFAKRERTVAVLKMNRFLTDVNWSYVVQMVTMRHPYHMSMDEDNEELHTFEYTFCEVCKKDVLQQPTDEELEEIKKEAMMQILKAKKMSYSRQYEHGMMSKQAVQMLSQAVDVAMDMEHFNLNIQEMCRKLHKENCIKRFMRRRAAAVVACEERKKRRKPGTYWRRICYHLVLTSRTFEKVMLVVVAIHSVLIIFNLFLHPSLVDPTLEIQHERWAWVHYPLLVFEFLFALIYLTEFVMKIMAYSWVHVWKDGFGRYFRSFWNITDFIAMLGCIMGINADIGDLSYEDYERNTFDVISDCLRLARLVRLLRVFDIFYSEFMTYFDKSVDLDMTFTFHLVKCYTYGNNVILEMLPHMIQNEKVKVEMQLQIEREMRELSYLLQKVQKEKPWIAITVKTTQAIRMVLKNMKDAISQLKLSGWVDSCEYETLENGMEELYKKVNSIKKVLPSPPDVIFKEVPWMAQDDSVVDFLFDNVTVKSYNDGEVVVGEGHVIDGIYIVVTGVMALNYTPNPTVIQNMKEYGHLPVVDYMHTLDYGKEHTTELFSGNCLGELGTLTQRSYNCTIKSDGPSQLYFLSSAVIKRAGEMSKDRIQGVESKIWKDVGARIALHILSSVPAYQNYGPEQIRFVLERAFVPDLRKIKVFTVTDMIEDIVLIDGVVADFNSRKHYSAPCYIARTIQKLILPQSSLMNLYRETHTKLLIIPTKDMDEDDVMLLAEETCELVASKSSRCLLHTVRDQKKAKRLLKHRRNRMRRRELAPSVHTQPSMASSLSSMSTSGMSRSDTLFTSEDDVVAIEPETEERPEPTMQRRKSAFFL